MPKSEVSGRLDREAERHRLLLTGETWSMALRIRRSAGERLRVSAAGDGSWYRWGTLRGAGLPATMSTPLALSPVSQQRLAAAEMEANTAADPARIWGAALLVPERGGVYLLERSTGVEWGGWGRFSLGAGRFGEAAVLLEAPVWERERRLAENSAVTPERLRPLRTALRLQGGSVEQLQVFADGFLSLSTVLPPGWAGCMTAAAVRERWELIWGVGMLGGSYPDRRGRLVRREFRGSLKGAWNPGGRLTVELRGDTKLRLPGPEGLGKAEWKGDGEGGIVWEPRGFRMRLYGGVAREIAQDELPQGRRKKGLRVSGQRKLWSWSGWWRRRERPAERLDASGGKFVLHPGDWRVGMEGKIEGAAGKTRRAAGTLLLQYGGRSTGYRVLAQLRWSGAYLREEWESGDGWSLRIGYRAWGELDR